MKKLLMLFVTIGVFLCMTLTGCTTFQIQESQTAGTEMPPNMPNPASAYCEENGNKLEIQTAEDGSQSGLCVFPDGSECDEWAYFRGECSPPAQILPTTSISDEATQKDSDDDVGENGSGGYMAPGTLEEIVDWWGVIKSTPPGAQYDDYFERQDLGGSICFGIDSLDPEVEAQIEALSGSGKIVHIYGTLFSNVPDYNGSQVQIDRIEIEE